MASISNDGGRRRIQFIHPDGRRLPIRLGKVSQRTAEAFARRVEQLLECMRLKQPMDADLASWVAELEDKTAGKLAACGLIPSRPKAETTALSAFMSRYVDGRHDVKPATKEIWRQGQNGLVAFFGSDKPLEAVTEGDADGYKQHMIRDGLAMATIRKRLYFAGLVFRAAVKHRLIPANPFADMRIQVPPPGRKHFITHEDTERLIDACPNHDWRAIIALSRYGGVRCPSEVLSLKWADIDWDPTHGVMHVHSPKTEHHAGKGSRIVPLFGLLRPHLERAFEAAPEGSVFVISESIRKAALGKSGWRNSNLRTQFGRIIKRAGMTPWPRLFHNLRSSRETELMAEHPPHDVCTWIGNSLAIAQRHYLQVTRASLARAVAEPAYREDEKAAQNPAQHLHAPGRMERNSPPGAPCQSPANAAPRHSVRTPATHHSGGHGIRTHNPLRGI
jgi:integrase